MATLDIIIRAQNQASAVLNSLKRDLQSLNQQAQDVGTALSLGVTAPFTLFAKTGIQTVSEFSRTMAELEVVTGASGDALQTLNDTAIELGAVTSFSANEAATAMLELSKAGMSTEEVLSSIPGVLALAAAGGVELGYAANLTASSLNAFQLEADQAGYVSNLLAAAANESSASIGDLAMGLQQGGFAFNAAGQDIDDLAASLAILTNVGLTGSDAGTALKNAFTRLMSPTKEAQKVMNELGISFYDVQGNMLPLADIIGVLNGAMEGMTQQQRNAALETIFLSDGMKAMIPLLTLGQDGFLEMKDAVNQAGAAQSVADAKMRGLAGAFEYASGSIESALLNVWMPLESTLASLIRQGADLITWLSQLPAPILNAALAFTAVLAAAGPLLLAIPMITAFLGAMLSPIGLVVVAVGALAAAWASDFMGIRQTTEDAAKVIGAFFEYVKLVVEDGDTLNDWLTHLPESVQPMVESFGNAIVELTDIFNEFIGIVSNFFAPSIERLSDTFGGLLEDMTPVRSSLGELGSAFDNLVTAVIPVAVAVGATLAAAFKTLLIVLSAVLESAGDIVNNFVTTLSKQINAAAQIIDSWVDLIVSIINGDWAGAWDAALSIIDGFAALAIATFEGMGRSVGIVFDIMAATVNGIIEDFRIGAAIDFQRIKNTITTAMSTAQAFVVQTWQNAIGPLESAWGAIRSAGASAFNSISSAINTVVNVIPGLQSAIQGVKDFLSNLSIPNPFSGIASSLQGIIDLANRAKAALGGIGGGGTSGANAAGTSYFRGGMTTINERGTELIALPGRNRQAWLPRGTAIYPAEQSPMLMGAGGGVTVNVYATVNNGMDAESLAHTIAGIMRRNQR